MSNRGCEPLLSPNCDVHRRDPQCPRAAAEDVADALAFALRFQGRKRVHNADEILPA
jgi:hypothetical protein